MNTILTLSDSCDNKHPEHFQVFLNNCVKTYKENFKANDYLFAAVYFIILETGFFPVELADKKYCLDSVNFDIRRLRSIKGYIGDQLRIPKDSKNSSGFIYDISLRLGGHSCSECELQGVPSDEPNTHLIINFLSKEPHIVKSICLSTEIYTEKNESSEHKYLLKNLKQLSNLIKNKVSVDIKDQILTNEEEGCSANLLCLPEGVQKKIIYYLISDPVSLQSLSSTCSYFYNFISGDSKLWEAVCYSECGNDYTKWMLSQVLLENSKSDTNVFKAAFLKLKTPKSSRFW